MELIEKHASFGGWQNVYRHYSQSLKCEMNVGVYLPPKAANEKLGNDSNLLIVFYVQIMPDDFVMQLHRF